MSVRFVVAAAMFALASTSIVPAAGTLDYDFYKAKVQPIFLLKRPGHAPCVMCHADANNMLHLEKLPDGQSSWTEEQTRDRIYFAAVCRCFPGKRPEGGDRVPAPDEIAACSAWGRLAGFEPGPAPLMPRSLSTEPAGARKPYCCASAPPR